MKASQLKKWTVLMALALAGLAARAEDIDIYQGGQTGGPPNLLIILDNAAAASASSSYTCTAAVTVNDPDKNLGFEQCGLYDAVSSIKGSSLEGNINLGLMYFPTGGTNGGTFVLPDASKTAPGSLERMDATGVKNMTDRISALKLSQDKSNNNQIAQAMQESWAFYQGKRGLSGVQYPGLSSAEACANNFVLYITLATNNQKPQDSGTAGGQALAEAQATTALPAQLPLPTWKTASGKYKDDYSDEWASFMYTGTAPKLSTPYPRIVTYTIILSDGSNPDYEQLMVSMASQGGGEALVVKLGDSKGFADAIKKIIYDVQAENSVFAAPVLPVSANAQGTYLNQVYVGMFRPDGNPNPRWTGNLKQYQFGVDTTNPQSPELFLGDASWEYPAGTTAQRALNGNTGFISTTARSFWTSRDDTVIPDSLGGFWVNAIKQGGIDGHDQPDGNIVEKGGVSQQIRLKYLTDTYTGSAATTSRNLYTCIGSCNSNAALKTMPFSISNSSVTAKALGVNLINWVRGDDTVVQEGDTVAGPEPSTPPLTGPKPPTKISVRGSVHGDVLHSRPVVINYGDKLDSAGNKIGVVAFYGANDGIFRAINGNQNNNTVSADVKKETKALGYCTTSTTCSIAVTDDKGQQTSVPPGGELWGFVPEEFYPGLQRLYENKPMLKLGGWTFGEPKTYFFDGPTSVYQNAKTDKAYIFLTARRGGRLIYALDVSDPTNPRFMWKRTNADVGFSELGQTWSQPKVAHIKGSTNPVLIFGAGYDTNQDAEAPNNTNSDTMGRGIFIVDALTGQMLWQAVPTGATCGAGVTCVETTGMSYSIPADITLVDRNFDGYIDRLYAADVGGNIWRVDLETKATDSPPNYDKSTWKVTQIAALGGTGSTKRKLFFPPDIVLTKKYDVLLATTGDREHPLRTQDANNIVNRFYMIKDTNVEKIASDWTVVRDDSTSTTNDPPPDKTQLFNATSTAYDQSLRGFYVSLLGLDEQGQSPSLGEKGVNAPTTVGGFVYFGTNQPKPPTSCKPDLGQARSYKVNFLTGDTTRIFFNGGGLLPSPVFGVVTVNVDGKPRQLPFLIGGGGSFADGKSGLGAQKPVIPIKVKKQRTYWYRDIDR